MPKKILLIYTPLCTPTNPPYSLFYLPSLIRAMSDYEIRIIDLNVELHKHFIKNPFNDFNDYNNKAKRFHKESGKLYKTINKALRDNEELPLFNEFVNLIQEQNPDFLVFTCLFNQQIFYAVKLAEHFKGKIKTVIGGPAATDYIKEHFDLVTSDIVKLFDFLDIEFRHKEFTVDYNIFDVSAYYTPEIVLPLRTSIGCCYAQCAFCNMHGFKKYIEFDPGFVKKQILPDKNYQLVDNIIPLNRLAKFYDYFGDLNIRYIAYSRVDKNPASEKFKKAYDSGCRVILWGVESGSQKMLDAMKKGITLEEIEKTLEMSNKAGIKNILYLIIGFPGETESTINETIDFLKKNSENIHLVAPNIFSIQPGSDVFNNPKKYGIEKIIPEKRKYLPPLYGYRAKGLNHEDFVKLKSKYKKELSSLNKYDFMFSVYKDHFLLRADEL